MRIEPFEVGGPDSRRSSSLAAARRRRHRPRVETRVETRLTSCAENPSVVLEGERLPRRDRAGPLRARRLPAGGRRDAAVAREPRRPVAAVLRVHPAHGQRHRPHRRARPAHHRGASGRRRAHPPALRRLHPAGLAPAGRRAREQPGRSGARAPAASPLRADPHPARRRPRGRRQAARPGSAVRSTCWSSTSSAARALPRT